MSRSLDLVVSLSLGCLAGCSPAAQDDGDSTSTSTSSSSSSTETGTTTTTPETETETGTDTDNDPRPARLLVTSDWRAHRLSLLDYAALQDGAESREAALWKTIDLPDHEPGPLEAELSPDGSLIVVAVGPGFFATQAGTLVGAGPGAVPEGGALLIVEVDSGAIVAELATAQYPMGVAFTDDGSAVWTANYGGNGQSGTTVSHIDLTSMSIVEEIDVGPGPEQLDIAGSHAIVNIASDGTIRTFDITDAAASLSTGVAVSGDPSWVLLLPGDQRAVSINSLGPPGYSLLDTSDVLAPVVVDTIEVVGIPYAGTFGPTDSQIVMTTIAGGNVAVQLFETETGELLEQIDVQVLGFPLGVVFDAETSTAWVPVPGANVLVAAEFGAGTYRELDWQDVPGPTYVSLE